MFSPYIGAGIGLNANTISGTLNYYQTDTGATYAGPSVNGSAPAAWVEQTGTNSQGNPVYSYLVDANGKGPHVPIGPQNWNRSFTSTKYTFAAALMAGVGIPISQS